MSFLFSLIVFALFSSCNVIQALGGGKTKVGSFGARGPQAYKVFFFDGSDLMVLDTKHGHVDTVGSSIGSASGFTRFGNKIFFKGTSSGMYAYDPEDRTLEDFTPFTSSLQSNFGVVDGKLTFYDLPGADVEICNISSPEISATKSCPYNLGSGSAAWIYQEPGSGDVYVCNTTMAPSKLGKLNTSTGNIENLLDSNSNTVDCANDYTKIDVGRFAATTDGGNAIAYDFSSNSVTNFGAGNANFLDREGNVFFSNGSQISRGDILTGASDNLANNYSVGKVIPTGKGLFYLGTDSDSGLGEIYRITKGAPPEKFSSLGIGGELYLAGGPDALYYIHSGGIEKVYYDGGTENIFSGTISGSFHEVR